MRKRADAVKLARLIQVLRARQTEAETALAHTRAVHIAAEAETQTQQDTLLQVSGEWEEHLACAGFAPEYARGLAHRIIVQEGTVRSARAEEDRAAQAHRERQHSWRGAAANTRAAEESMVDVRRTIARRREEKRLDALSDRVTYRWMQR